MLIFFFSHAACGILFLQTGIEPMPPVLEVWSLNRWTAREAFWLPVLTASYSQSHHPLFLPLLETTNYFLLVTVRLPQ